MNDERVRPIFVIGSPRSGTSILSWCLGQHPNLLPLEESNWFADFGVALRDVFDVGMAREEKSQLGAMGITRNEFYENFGDAIHRLIMRYKGRYVDRAEADPEYGDFLRLTRSPLDPKARWIDATPEYSFHVFALRQMFPHAQFIHIVRDVSAVVHSLMRLRMPDGSTVVETEDAAYLYWLRTVRACLEAERILDPQTILRIRYRNLIESPESCLRLCLDFLEESFCSDCLIPLRMKINSSSSLPHPNPSASPVNANVKLEAETLSEMLLEDDIGAPTSDPPMTATRERSRRTQHPSQGSDGLSSQPAGPLTSEGLIPLGATLTVGRREPGDEYNGSAVVAWDTGTGADGEVWVAADGEPETLFARGARGCETVTWLLPGTLYNCRLYAGTDRITVLASTTITTFVPVGR